MEAIILAAGVGSRLKPITDSKPKCLVKVCGKTILMHQIEAYLEAGADCITIVVGYKSDQVHSFVQQLNNPKIQVVNNEQYNKTNNMYSLWLCKNVLNRSNKITISNADVVFSKSIVCRLSEINNDAIVCQKNYYNQEAMKITVSNNLIINDISKKIVEKEAFGCSIDMYLLCENGKSQLIKVMNKIIKFERELNQWTEVALQRLAKEGLVNFLPFCINENENWYEIDDNKDLLCAEIIFSELAKKISKKKNFIFDLDGTIYVGEKPISGATKLVSKLQKEGKSIRFISNNSSKNKIEYKTKLKSMGIQIDENQVTLSTDAAIDALKQKGYRKGFILGTKSMIKYLKDGGLFFENKNPEFVLLGYDTEVTYTKLKKGALFIQNGVPYYATHADNFCPTSEGKIPDAGAFIKLFETTLGIIPTVFGKPEKTMAQFITDGSQNLDDYVLIGDRLYTDFKMANSIGLNFICVLTGETTRENLENSTEWPELVVDSVKDIISMV